MSSLLIATLLNLVMSREVIRFDAVAEQEYRDSCGYSVVGTLLGIYWGLPFDETALLKEAGVGAEGGGGRPADGAGPPPTEGRSLTVAGMLTLIEGAGLLTQGFRLKEAELRAAAQRFAPVVVHFAKPEKHYALLLSAGRDHFVIADPSRGLISISRRRFLHLWSGVALLATGPDGHTVRRSTVTRAVSVVNGRRLLLEDRLWR